MIAPKLTYSFMLGALLSLFFMLSGALNATLPPKTNLDETSSCNIYYSMQQQLPCSCDSSNNLWYQQQPMVSVMMALAVMSTYPYRLISLASTTLLSVDTYPNASTSLTKVLRHSLGIIAARLLILPHCSYPSALLR